MKLNLLRVDTKDKEVLSNLLTFYQKELGRDRPDEYKYLDSYFNEENRFAFFIKLDNNIAGFALVNEYVLVEKNAKSIAEFYVKKKYRNMGIGKESAKRIFNLFPGKWEIRQLANNKGGQAFWYTVIKEYTNNNFKVITLDNENWKGPVQIFENSKDLK